MLITTPPTQGRGQFPWLAGGPANQHSKNKWAVPSFIREGGESIIYFAEAALARFSLQWSKCCPPPSPNPLQGLSATVFDWWVVPLLIPAQSWRMDLDLMHRECGLRYVPATGGWEMAGHLSQGQRPQRLVHGATALFYPVNRPCQSGSRPAPLFTYNCSPYLRAARFI